MSETILIVEDEDSVRRTFREWLEEAPLDCRVLTAADAEEALIQANQQTIDLAILDWNLGAGNDGLHLLEDLTVFHPDIVAILVTGYAHQATPLEAMRMGVRDYLDKNQDLTRDAFLQAVQRQLARIRPAKRERQLHQGLVAFREAVEKVLPLVQTAAALHDPLPLPDAVASLFRFVLGTTEASDGVLLLRRHEPEHQPPEIIRVYDPGGRLLTTEVVPFARSLAGAVAGMGEPRTLSLGETAEALGVELQPFERGRRTLLAAPLAVEAGVQVVLELFDKAGGSDFSPADVALVRAAADFGGEMFRQALAGRRSQRLLLDAVAAALRMSDSVQDTLAGSAARGRARPPPPPRRAPPGGGVAGNPPPRPR
ncbi:MAG: response regulator, partial [Gemmataceae bacterium]|nr:response regulator [Gemmataceae bacterium]MDW8267296.1 response regulator [Gemmataceae bacterium]